MKHLSSRPGFTFLLAVLSVGVIALTTTVSLLLLGGAAQRTSYAVFQSNQAFENAQTCVERALYSLRGDLNYVGGETKTLDNGTCVLKRIGGYGNADRAVCAAGIVGSTVRRIELLARRIYPRVEIVSEAEVASGFTLCP